MFASLQVRNVQRRKYTRAKLRNIMLPLMSLKGQNYPIISSNSCDNLIAFCFCFLLCVSYLYFLYWVGTHTNKSINIICYYKKISWNC